MIHLNFVASNNFELEYLQDIEMFVDNFPDFQSVELDNEKELTLLLSLIGLNEPSKKEIDNSEFSFYYDISKHKLPEFDEDQFNTFYRNWIDQSKRDNNMDEYGNLIFLQGLSVTRRANTYC